jgi:RND family efflux transporter MFP subunit
MKFAMLRNKTVLIAAAGAATLLVLILWQIGAFTFGRVAPGTTAAAPAAISGTPMVVTPVTVPVTYRAVGTVSSRSVVDVAPRIVARVRELPVRDGDRVSKGDLLVKLDDADLVAAVNQAREQLRAVQAGVTGAAEKVQQTQAALDLVTTDLGRMRQLAASGTISQQALDNAESNYRQTRATLAQAEQAQAAAAAVVLASEQAVRQAEAFMSYATILSPMDGVVAERMADPGDLASPGNILLRLFDPVSLLLEAPIREGLVGRLKLGDIVPFTVDALNTTLEGDIREIVPSVDPGSRTFMVKICIGKAPQLMPGMFGVLQLPMGTRQALLIPADAVIRVGQLEYVRAMLGDRVERVLVRTISADSNQCEIVTGLTAGMTIYRE